MATTPDLHEAQIASARTAAWHQAGDPLLTLEAARTFLNQHGFVLFAPRTLGAPSPSLVEATLGTTKPSSTAAENDTARSLAARLIGEGNAIPLNLFGGPGDLPDFLVSASAFPFVFTLRGDKGWKRPPETTGSVKVTPLALRVYELLAERGAMTVVTMVPEIGREVTESAVARALTELWTLLRVIPVLQQGEGETQWELLTSRFLKAVKAGANAGQPTALSALISLYLGQVFLATEEEIASFLSPLTARSRVRDVLHGLTAGRQLSEAVLEGKTVLYIPEALPDFAQLALLGEAPRVDLVAGNPDETHSADSVEGTGSPDPETVSESGERPQATEAGEGRIRRFEGGPEGAHAKPFRGKPVVREGGFRSAPRSPERGARGPRPGGPRPSRPFNAGAGRPPRDAAGPTRDRAAGDRPTTGPDARPSFSRPWEEERGARPPRDGADARPARSEGTGDRPFRPRDDSRPPRREGTGEGRPPFRRDDGGARRPPFRREAPGGDAGRPSRDARPPFRREGTGESRPPFRSASRPPFRSDDAGGRPPFRREGSSNGANPSRPYTPRPRREEGDGFPARRPSGDSREAGPDRRPDRRPDRAGFAPRPGSRPDFKDRPARRDAGEAGDRPRTNRPFPPRDGAPRGPRSGGDRPSFGRPSFDRPSFGRSGPDRSSSDRPRSASGGSFGDRPPRNFDRPSPGGGPRFGGKGEDRGPSGSRPPFRGAGPEGRSFSPRPPRTDDSRPRPQSGFGARSAPRAAGGFNRGPARGGPTKGAPRDRPSAPLPRPEDEA